MQERIINNVNELRMQKLTAVRTEDVDVFLSVCSSLNLVACGGAFTWDDNKVITGKYFYIG